MVERVEERIGEGKKRISFFFHNDYSSYDRPEDRPEDTPHVHAGTKGNSQIGRRWCRGDSVS
jgi:hypothetical protein